METAEKDTSFYIKQALKEVYCSRQLVLVLLLAVLSIWGTIDSYIDIVGDRILALVPFFTPAILSAWYMIGILWKNNRDMPDIMRRLYNSCFIVAVPIVLFNIILLIVTWLVPSLRTLVELNAGNHYWWPAGFWGQFAITSIVGYVGQMVGGVFAILIVVFPALAVKKPKAVTEGTGMEKIKDDGKRNLTSIFLYFGLSIYVIGVIIALTAEDLDFPEMIPRLERIIDGLQSGYVDMGWMMWLFGLLLIIIGIVLVILAIVKMSIQKGKNNRRE